MIFKRKKWAITINDIGFKKTAFIGSILFVSFFSILIFIGKLLSLKGLVNYSSAQSFSVSQNIEKILIYNFILLLLLFLFILVLYGIGKFQKRANSTWFDVLNLAERKIGNTDLTIITLSVSFFLIKLLNGNFFWYHFFIFISIIIAYLFNYSSKSNFWKIPEVIKPEPIPTVHPDEDEPLFPNEDYYKRAYKWSCNDQGSFEIDPFWLSKKEYEQAREHNKKDLANENGFYDSYQKFVERVTLGLTDDLKRLINEIAKTHKDKSTIYQLNNLLQFVHDPNFKYSSDEESTGYKEYARFPIETLVEKTGDCECLAILVASLFKLHGYQVVLLLTKRHCLAGVEVPLDIRISGAWVKDKNGIKYWICEATGTGWTVGEYKGNDSFEILPV